MNIYPDVLGQTIKTQPGVKAVIPFESVQQFGTIVTKYDSGVELRRQKMLYPTYSVRLQYNHLYQDAFEILKKAFEDNHGGFDRMAFYYPHIATHTKVYAGTITQQGSSHSFKLPSFGIQAGTIDLSTGGQIIVAGSDPNLLQGPDGGTRYEYSGSIAAGTRIFWSFDGRLKSEVVFDSDDFEMSEVKGQWYSLTVSLRGLLPLKPVY